MRFWISKESCSLYLGCLTLEVGFTYVFTTFVCLCSLACMLSDSSFIKSLTFEGVLSPYAVVHSTIIYQKFNGFIISCLNQFKYLLGDEYSMRYINRTFYFSKTFGCSPSTSSINVVNL